jgi:hypothetical protein
MILLIKRERLYTMTGAKMQSREAVCALCLKKIDAFGVK